MQDSLNALLYMQHHLGAQTPSYFRFASCVKENASMVTNEASAASTVTCNWNLTVFIERKRWRLVHIYEHYSLTTFTLHRSFSFNLRSDGNYIALIIGPQSPTPDSREPEECSFTLKVTMGWCNGKADSDSTLTTSLERNVLHSYNETRTNPTESYIGLIGKQDNALGHMRNREGQDMELPWLERRGYTKLDIPPRSPASPSSFLIIESDPTPKIHCTHKS